MTALEWIKAFESYLTLIKNRSHNTVRSYILDAELLYRFATTGELGEPRRRLALIETDFDWGKLTEETAVDYLRVLKASGVKESTVQRRVLALKQFFKFLRKKGATTADPFGDFETHALQRTLPRTLSINEMNQLLTCIRQPIAALLGVPSGDAFMTIRDRAMLETLYSAALRVSELCGMKWQDIDFNKREVQVTGKGNKTRMCPLGQPALNALLEYQHHYEQRWERKPEGPAPVFLSTWNMQMNQRTVPRLICKWCRRAGVKVVNPHAFRHSAATHMLEGGADIRVVQVLLGHAHLITTEIYTHIGTRKLKTTHANTHPRA